MSPPMMSKEAARYTGAGGREHCSLCRHFSPRRGGRCARVLGDISPIGWCRLFSREMRGLVADASSFNGGGGPTLGLDFMQPGSLDQRITFTRASTATYFDSAGVMRSAAVNAPRWDYDPSTLALRGLLIEEARTNVLLNSATLSTQSVTVTAQAYTLSFTGTGTVTKSGTATGALVGTGVGQRVTQTFTPTAGTLTLTVTGTVSNAQIEAGAFATSYVPTTSAAVTRAQDRCSISAANMAPWFNALTGSWFAEFVFQNPTSPNIRILASLGQPAGGSAGMVFVDPAQHVAQYDGGTALVTTSPALVVNAVSKGASTWAAGTGQVCGNGGAVLSGAMPGGFGTLSTLGVCFLIPSNPGVTDNATGYLRRVSYWSRALTGAEMQTVTTL